MNHYDDPAPYVQTEKEAAEAHDILLKVLDLEQDDQRNALKEGMYLHRLRQMRGWEQLGYDSEIAMFASNNLDVRCSQYKRRATVWYREYGISPDEYVSIGYTKLAYLAGHATKNTARSILDRFGKLSYRDIKKELDPLQDRAPEGFRRVECPRCGWHFEYMVPLGTARKDKGQMGRVRDIPEKRQVDVAESIPSEV